MYDYNARITNVVDGDTVDATIDVGFRMSAVLRLRLLGVNCPELHGAEHDRGLAAKQFTWRELQGYEVVIETHKSDVFGRWLARILINGVDFNQRLLDEGLAVPYVRKLA